MFKQRLANFLLLLAAIFGVGLVLGVLLPRWVSLGSGPKVYNTAMLLEEVKTLSQLVTVQYVIERTVVVEIPPDGVLSKMFAGENRLLMVVHGVVKAGLDLSQLQPDALQVSKKTIFIKISRPQITDAYLDDKQTRVVERSTGFLREFDKDLEQSTRQTAVEDIRRAARMNGILNDAEVRAKEQLTKLFQQLGFERVEFKTK
jgi:hypothetical protein